MTIERRDIWAVVPVKSLAGGKQRLGGLLTPDERRTLSRAMLEDVLSALARTPVLAGVLVVTADGIAADAACAFGALVLRERRDAGTGAAVMLAAQRLEAVGRETLLVVPADVPLIRPADVERIVAAHRPSPSVSIVAASADGGTNALACSPPRLLPFAYGEGSFCRHVEAARARGVAPSVLEIESIGRDIDRPGDLAAFIQRPSATRAFRYLQAIRVADRMGEARAAPAARQPAQALY